MALVTNTTNERDRFGNDIMDMSSVGLNTAVRYARTENGLRFSMVDVVRAVTGQSSKHISKIIERLPVHVSDEVTTGGHNLQFKGPGQKETTLITYEGVFKLIMALPGINAREMRTKFATVLQRYFAGDASLVPELIANNASDAPLNALAREDAGVEQVITEARIKAIVDEAYQTSLEKFRSQRRLKLYDDKVAELRRDKEHKRQKEMSEINMKMIEAEKSKLACEMENRADVNEKLRDELGLLERKLQLTAQLKADSSHQAPCIVSVSRVADQVLPIDTMSEAFRNKVLVAAGHLAASSLPAERHKITSLFGQPENWYHDKYYERMADLLAQAYKNAQASWRAPERPLDRYLKK